MHLYLWRDHEDSSEEMVFYFRKYQSQSKIYERFIED